MGWIGAVETEFECCGMTDLKVRRSAMLNEVSKEHWAVIKSFYTLWDNQAEGQWGYQALKNELRLLFKEKDRQRTARLLQPHSLGGRTPSQFLAILKAEMAGITMDMLAKEILASVLPQNIKAIVTTDTNSPFEMAAAADSYSSSGQILERTAAQTVYAATPPTVSPPSYDGVQDADLAEGEEAEEGPEASQTYASICAAYRGPQRERQRPQQDQRQRPQQDQRRRSRNGYSAPTGDLCFYHRTFGDEARNCLSFCSCWGNARAGGPQ